MDFITYKEFKKEIKSNFGASVEYSFGSVNVVAQDLGAPMGGTIMIASVSTSEQFNFQVMDISDTVLSYGEWEGVAKLCLKLARTPLDKRGNYPVNRIVAKLFHLKDRS